MTATTVWELIESRWGDISHPVLRGQDPAYDLLCDIRHLLSGRGDLLLPPGTEDTLTCMVPFTANATWKDAALLAKEGMNMMAAERYPDGYILTHFRVACVHEPGDNPHLGDVPEGCPTAYFQAQVVAA